MAVLRVGTTHALENTTGVKETSEKVKKEHITFIKSALVINRRAMEADGIIVRVPDETASRWQLEFPTMSEESLRWEAAGFSSGNEEALW
jgi:hypothetical protein